MKRPDSKGRADRNEFPAELKKQKHKRSKGARAALIVLISLLFLVCIGIVAYAIWATPPDVSDSDLKDRSTPAPTEIPEETPAPSFTPEPEATPTPEPTAEPLRRREDTYTLLVVGRDRVGLNTDTIMVARLDCAAETLDVVSIPRDTLVDVPWAVKKINSIYGTLGTEGLLEGVEDLVGFDIDNYVIVNTFVFRDVIDYIGGVYFDVPIYMNYDDPLQDLYIHMSPGYQLLNGDRAEQVVRFRQNNDGSGYPTGDLGRIETQHAFFRELAKQVLSLGNIANLPQIINLVLDNTDTDLTSGNMAFYAQEFFKLSSDNVRFYTMPHENVYIRGGSYVSIQLEPWLEMINESLNPFNMDVTEENLSVITYGEQGIYSTTGNPPGMGSFFDYYSYVE